MIREKERWEVWEKEGGGGGDERQREVKGEVFFKLISNNNILVSNEKAIFRTGPKTDV